MRIKRKYFRASGRQILCSVAHSTHIHTAINHILSSSSTVLYCNISYVFNKPTLYKLAQRVTIYSRRCVCVCVLFAQSPTGSIAQQSVQSNRFLRAQIDTHSINQKVCDRRSCCSANSVARALFQPIVWVDLSVHTRNHIHIHICDAWV